MVPGTYYVVYLSNSPQNRGVLFADTDGAMSSCSWTSSQAPPGVLATPWQRLLSCRHDLPTQVPIYHFPGDLWNESSFFACFHFPERGIAIEYNSAPWTMRLLAKHLVHFPRLLRKADTHLFSCLTFYLGNHCRVTYSYKK